MSDNYEKNMNNNSTSDISTNDNSTNENSANETSANDINTNEINMNDISTNDNSTNDIQNEIHERHHHKDGHERHHRNKRNKNHGGKCKRHGGFGRIGYDNENDDDLLSLLAKSSHILHHQKSGKRGQGKILKILADHQEINQKELQEILNIESGSMSELVIKLEHKGFITRTKDETDRRMTKLMITELGLEKSKELEARDEEDNKVIYGSLSEQEQEELKVLLKKFLKGFEENFELLHENEKDLHDTGNNRFDKEEHVHSNGYKHHQNGGKGHGSNRH